MLRNYLLIAFHNLRKYKTFSFINTTGVAVGLACFLLFAIYVKDELNYDRYNTRADRIYRVTRTFLLSDGTPSLKLAQTEQVVRTIDNGGLIRYGENSFNEDDIFVAEANPFSIMFSRPMAPC